MGWTAWSWFDEMKTNERYYIRRMKEQMNKKTYQQLEFEPYVEHGVAKLRPKH